MRNQDMITGKEKKTHFRPEFQPLIAKTKLSRKRQSILSPEAEVLIKQYYLDVCFLLRQI